MQIPIKSLLEIESCVFYTGTTFASGGIITTPTIRITARIYPFNHKGDKQATAPAVTFETTMSPEGSNVLLAEIERALGEMVIHKHTQMSEGESP